MHLTIKSTFEQTINPETEFKVEADDIRMKSKTRTSHFYFSDSNSSRTFLISLETFFISRHSNSGRKLVKKSSIDNTSFKM